MTFKHLLATLALLAFISPTTSYADYIAVQYTGGKSSYCKVKYEYYDGDKKAVTCTITDGGYRASSNDYVKLQCNSGKIRHLNHKYSGVLISAWRTGGEAACSDSEIKVVRAKKTAGKDVTETAPNFNASQTNRKYFKGRVSDSSCYERIDTKTLAENSDTTLNVRFTTTTKDISGGFTSCNRVVYYNN